ncbi:tetratricopeptide repeat protein [Chitinophaga lutea]
MKFLYRSLLSLCIPAVLSAWPATASPAGEGRSIKLYKQGLQLQQSGRFDEAEQLFQAAIRRDERFADAYLALAGLYRQQQQPEPAKQQLKRLLERQPDHNAALFALAEICFEAGDWEDAMTWAYRAKQTGATHRLIGLCYARLDHAAEAIRSLEAAYADSALSGADLCSLARLHAMEAQYDESIHWYEIALKCGGHPATVYYELGMMYFNMKNYNNATGAFEQAARLGRPVDADLYLNLGVARLKEAAYDDAIRLLQAAGRLRPKDIQVMLNLANAYFKKQDFRNAAVQWNNILMQQPQNAFAMFMLGKSYICSGEVLKGQAICDQAMNISGN